MMISNISSACVLTMLILLVEHYLPWRMILGRELPRLAAYVLGVLGMLIPLTVLFINWEIHPPYPFMQYGHLISVWVVIASGGLAVMLAFALDWVAARVRLSFELQELVGMRDEIRTIDEAGHS